MHSKQRKILPGAEPIFLAGRSKVGVLCLHGFTGSPWDFKELGDFLCARGLWVSAPLLVGHGTSVLNLAKTRWRDWLASVEAAYEELSKHCKAVFVVGISLGANLGMILAAKNKIAGIVSIGGNLSLRSFHKILVILSPLLKLICPYYKKGYQKGRLSRSVREKRVGYGSIPLANAFDIYETVKEARKAVAQIQCPLLNLVSKTDHVVGRRTLSIFEEYLGDKFKTIEFADGYHVLTVDPRVKERTFEKIWEFIKEQASLAISDAKLPNF